LDVSARVVAVNDSDVGSPVKQVYITENIGNFRVNFEKINKIENEGQAKEKLVFEVPKTVWNKTLSVFLAEYTRVK
jgi:hypothetical protein